MGPFASHAGIEAAPSPDGGGHGGRRQVGKENRAGCREGTEAVSYATFARKAPVASASRTKAATSPASGALRIGDANDAYEQEADRVTNEVMFGGAVKRHWS